MHQSMNLMQELRLFLILVHIYEPYNTARYAVLTASNKCFPLSFFISHALIEEWFARRVSLILLPKKNLKGFIFSSFHPKFCYSQLIAGKENLYSFFPSVSDWLHSVKCVRYGGCLGLYLGEILCNNTLPYPYFFMRNCTLSSEILFGFEHQFSFFREGTLSKRQLYQQKGRCQYICLKACIKGVFLWKQKYSWHSIMHCTIKAFS